MSSVVPARLRPAGIVGTPEAVGWKLPCGEVHVWTATLDHTPFLDDECMRLLAPAERARAGDFRRDQDRSRFVRARAAVRTLLGRHLDVAPGEIQFRYQRFGKPTVLAPATGAWLDFNVSHSADLAIVALARHRRVGVDVERTGSLGDIDTLARTVCSPGEVRALNTLAGQDRERAFLRCWTRKEAVLKAMGTGLWVSPSQIEVSLVPDQPAALLSLHGMPADDARWSLIEISPGEGYVAALAVEGQGGRSCGER